MWGQECGESVRLAGGGTTKAFLPEGSANLDLGNCFGYKFYDSWGDEKFGGSYKVIDVALLN